ncbi:hypothetical protein LAUMK35_00724 [Mycobacterium pseudokansasii]|uniref:Uncharacterized protein n=1 Tax=Mycobacterium pseudokansasii TaxID=2341080 RepID=A0A498QME3_9MYCO|nr:hypothetical protein [Mycobacterium pseudokansasii]KZS61105.1 hypothetical protein A4G27_16595 [Mycobacterium kansasii]VAZ88932.1 hypothetical protein LAUMK35_00724 [Mycobacterium pseudokansasii]VAZ89428.1 hypothetical protein LAUMK21_00722 [Mycobacterium pseudokansasii]VBA49769.1 hypothetical protein LAUMK142_02175 [Mycobacterium pseudokansasii]
MARNRSGEPLNGKQRRNRRARQPPCAECGRPIDPPSSGYAFVSTTAARFRQQRYREWVAHRLRFGSVTNPPPPRVPWYIVHRDCHADPDYSRLHVLPLSRVSTHRKLVEAVLKLSYEHWLADTDWQPTIRAILDARRGHG